MKKLLIILLLQLFSVAYATEEITLDVSSPQKDYGVEMENLSAKPLFTDDLKQRIAIQDTQPLERIEVQSTTPNFLLNNALTRTVKEVYNLEIERTDIPSCLLGKQLTKKFDRGPLESIHLWSAVQSGFDTTIPQRGDTDTLFNVSLINIMIDGKFRGGKEGFRIMFDPTHQHNRPFLQQFIQDLYVETTRIPHHTIMLGNSRVGVGHEGTMSPYTLPFVTRSQIARNLSNVRKFGIRVKGDYRLVDYDFGGYSSDTFFKEFFPGVEFNGMVNFKPLGMTDGRYGKLVTGGGISSGHNDLNYFLSSLYAGYEYKRFYAKFEYIHGNGSNSSSGPTTRKASGLCATLSYKITKKLEFLLRYDNYDPDEKVAHNYSREYTAGINYYLKGQALKLMLNYVFCQHQNTKDSHRILIGTQILL
jgi:hypothetical protein